MGLVTTETIVAMVISTIAETARGIIVIMVAVTLMVAETDTEMVAALVATMVAESVATVEALADNRCLRTASATRTV